MEKENLHTTERRYGAFSRTIELPVDVDHDKVSATYRAAWRIEAQFAKIKKDAIRQIDIKASE